MGSKPKVIVTVYGEGGHAEEAERLVRALQASSPTTQFASLSDVKLVPDWSVLHLDILDFRHKMTGKLNFKAPLQAFKAVRQLRQHAQVVGCLSTGPGTAIFPVIILRLCGVKVVHVETSCRFYQRSLTGSAMRFLANRFIVQNKELLKIYPKAEYGGRL